MAQQPFTDYDKHYLLERPAKLSTLRSAFIENRSARDWDLTYNRLEISVDPNINHIEGNVLFEFTSLVDSLKAITIDLDDSLRITSIQSGTKSCLYTHENKYIQIQLPQALNKNETGSFIVRYEGVPNASGFGSFVQNLHQGIPAIYTLSEPYNAKEWWPCKESLSDKIDSIDIIVETPVEYRSASNGLLVSDSVANHQRICHWKHRHPISTYLVFFSSSTYEVYADSVTFTDGTNMQILNYIYPESLTFAKLYTPYTVDYIKFFSQKFIDYPFKNEKYGHAQFGWNGGMEHQTMTSLGGFSKGIIAHELAHQWFGDYITCASWNELWLNEGFATYLEELVEEAYDSASWKAWKAKDMLLITSVPDGSVYVNDISDIKRLFDERLTYEKGAYVLHMLRGQLSDDTFFKGMRNYLNDPRAVNGFATTAVFRENMEQAADTTLTEFFADWIMGEGYPIYDLEWSYSNNQIAIDVYQKPSTKNGSFFEMKLPVTITSNGKEETYWLPNTQPSQHFSIDAADSPQSVTFNKDNWILCTQEDFHTSVSILHLSEISILYNASEKQLTASVPETEEANYSIYDVQGRILKSGIWKKNNPIIQLNRLNPGVYILSISTPQKKYHSRFRCD